MASFNLCFSYVTLDNLKNPHILISYTQRLKLKKKSLKNKLFKCFPNSSYYQPLSFQLIIKIDPIKKARDERRHRQSGRSISVTKIGRLIASSCSPQSCTRRGLGTYTRSNTRTPARQRRSMRSVSLRRRTPCLPTLQSQNNFVQSPKRRCDDRIGAPTSVNSKSPLRSINSESAMCSDK